jgi:hypothetical protein
MTRVESTFSMHDSRESRTNRPFIRPRENAFLLPEREGQDEGEGRV